MSSRLARPEKSRLPSGISPLAPDDARALLGRAFEGSMQGPALERVRRQAPEATARVAELTSMAGDPSLGELLYVLVRGVRPSYVVETGVAQGITSAYILAGLNDNGMGELHSIDLPSRAMIDTRLVGAAVPQDLRNRWVYHWGPSSRLLPRLLERLGPLQLFIHDSDHRYANMRCELELALGAAVEGAWIVADDVELHSAFQDVATSAGTEPLYVFQSNKRGWTGLMRKPAVQGRSDPTAPVAR